MKNRLASLLGFTSQELDDVLDIIVDYLMVEVALDGVGSIEPFMIGLAMEIPEMGVDIMMCIRLWSYFNNKDINEENKYDFIGLIKSNPFETAKSGLLAYAITSILKYAIGKAGTFFVLPVVAPVIASGTINATQTITTGLLWAMHCKKKLNQSQKTMESMA